jgi:hypothetical protein
MAPIVVQTAAEPISVRERIRILVGQISRAGLEKQDPGEQDLGSGGWPIRSPLSRLRQ